MTVGRDLNLKLPAEKFSARLRHSAVLATARHDGLWAYRSTRLEPLLSGI